jgi:hypothetical protein
MGSHFLHKTYVRVDVVPELFQSATARGGRVEGESKSAALLLLALPSPFQQCFCL